MPTRLNVKNFPTSVGNAVEAATPVTLIAAMVLV